MSLNNKEQDVAGKWRIWVDMGNETQIMLKFQTEPKDTEIEEAVKTYISNQKPDIRTKEKIAGEISVLQEQVTRLQAEKVNAPSAIEKELIEE